MISKIKVATDLQIKGSMLLKRNKIFELISKSLKKLYFSMTSSKNLERNLLYNIYKLDLGTKSYIKSSKHIYYQSM